MVDTLGTQTAEAKQFYDRTLMDRAKPILALTPLGQARSIPKNQGNQVSYRRFNQIATATTALTESVTPVASALSITEVTGTVAQYGNYVLMSDLIQTLGIDMVATEAMEMLGENAGQSVEEIVRSEVQAGTSVQYTGGNTARVQLDATDVLTYAAVRKAVRNLRANDANPFSGTRSSNGQGGLYAGIVHPYVWNDFVGDTTILNTFSYSDPDKIYKMEVPYLGEVMWIVTTKAPKFAGGGAAGADVYGTLLFGKNAFGYVDVAGTGKFQSIVKERGSAGTSDPLNQRSSCGWASLQLPKILNNNFMIRIESGATA
jgi:N4-gp56 family major capsid protein